MAVWRLDGAWARELGVQSVTVSAQDRAGQEEERTGSLLSEFLLWLLYTRGAGLPRLASPGTDNCWSPSCICRQVLAYKFDVSVLNLKIIFTQVIFIFKFIYY